VPQLSEQGEMRMMEEEAGKEALRLGRARAERNVFENWI